MEGKRERILSLKTSQQHELIGVDRWGVAKGSSVSWVAKFKGDKIQNASCQMGGREVTRR